MPEHRSRQLLSWLIRRRVELFSLGMLVSICAALVGRDLALDRSIEHMFAETDPILAPYLELQEVFGRHEIVLAVYTDQQLKTPAGLERLEDVVAKVRKVPGIVAAVSILDPPKAADFEDTARGARLREVFSGYTHSETFDAAGIVCLFSRPTSADTPRRETIRQLRALMANYTDGTIVGEPVVVEEAFDLLEADGRRLSTWCTLLLLLTILVCFRSLRWLILPLVVVQMTLALTRGLLVLLDLELSIVSSMLAAIVTVVGVATVVHVIVRYRDANSRGLTPTKALVEVGGILVAPIFFACMTDAAGFAALMASRVGPVQDFGIMMAVGCLLVLVSVAVAVPTIVLAGKERSNRVVTLNESRLQSVLQRLLTWSIRNSKGLLLFSGFVVVAAGIGCTQLVRETDFTRNFRQASPLIRGYEFVEKEFSGAGVWDILISAPRRLDKRFLMDVIAFEKKLVAEVSQLNKAISVADILDAGSGGLDKPELQAKIAIRGGLSLMRARMPEFVDAIHFLGNKEARAQIRIMLRSPERLDAAEKTQIIEQVESLATEAFPGARVTGYYVLLAELVDSLLRDQWITFGVAAVAIVAMMVLAFRSLRLAVVTLIPNVLPVFVLFGAMGWLGVRVNMGAAMIAAVSLGLSVDGSIHYVMSYLRELQSGISSSEALQLVQNTVGRATVLATLALVVGFATLCFSDFVPTIYFGGLVSLSMIGGLAGNLIVLPVLIKFVEE